MLSNVIETTTTAAYYGEVAESVNGALSYTLSDPLGSAAASVNTSGVVSATQFYGPYGSVRSQSGTLPINYEFTHQRADATSGLDYYGARYYDPVAGQFTSADMTLAGGLNRYAYGGGQVEYGSTDLSQAVKDQRIAARDVSHNYAAARLDNDNIITAVSDANGHAEQYLLEDAQSRDNSIVELYSERQPCAARSAGRLSEADITNFSWNWDWNGVDHASVSSEMSSFFRAMMP